MHVTGWPTFTRPPLEAWSHPHSISYLIESNSPFKMVFKDLIPWSLTHVEELSQAPRGLSAEEKRVKLLEIFCESVSFQSQVYICVFNLGGTIQKDFFQLKELEKLGPKLKGIGMSRISDFERPSDLESLCWRDVQSVSVSEGSIAISCGWWVGFSGQDRIF